MNVWLRGATFAGGAVAVIAATLILQGRALDALAGEHERALAERARQAERPAAAIHAPTATPAVPAAAPSAPPPPMAPLPPKPSETRDLARWARELATSKQPEARETLRAAFLGSASLVERMLILPAIVEHPRPGDDDFLRGVLGDENPNVALEALRGMVKRGRAPDEAFEEALSFARRGVPALAAFVERRTAEGKAVFHRQALDYCIEASRLPAPRVQIEAAGGLVQLGRPEEGFRALEEHLGPSAPLAIRLHALDVLGRAMDVPGVRPFLEVYRDDADPAFGTRVRSLLRGNDP